MWSFEKELRFGEGWDMGRKIWNELGLWGCAGWNSGVTQSVTDSNWS